MEATPPSLPPSHMMAESGVGREMTLNAGGPRGGIRRNTHTHSANRHIDAEPVAADEAVLGV